MGILYWDVNSIHLSRRLTDTDSDLESQKSERSVRTSIALKQIELWEYKNSILLVLPH